MITVLQPGTRTTIQDAGRPGFRHMGIPRSGAADRLSFALANWMVGNPWHLPALECTLGGLHVQFSKKVRIAIAGAEMWAQVNGQNVANFTSFPVDKGDILTFSFARRGCRAYLAVQGGLSAEDFMGSGSTYLPAQLGGLEGRALRSRDIVKLRPSEEGAEISEARKLSKDYRPQFSDHIVLRAMPGPEYDNMSAEAQRHLFINAFTVTVDASRMGVRLRGNRLVMDEANSSMTSSPIQPGTLQIPPDGLPIIMGVDGHCTGGYPRALQVIRADHWLMGQIKPGTKVSFQRCFGKNAETILRRRDAFYGQLIDGFSF